MPMEETPLAPPCAWREEPGFGTVLVYRGHGTAVRAAAWSPAGDWIASGSQDGALHIWHGREGSHLCTYQHAQPIERVRWTADGKFVITGWPAFPARLWYAATVRSGGSRAESGPALVPDSFDPLFSWSPDGTRIAVRGPWGDLRILRTKKAALVSSCSERATAAALGALAWSPNGQLLAGGAEDGVLQVWNAGDGSLRFAHACHDGPVTALAWSPDGTRVASAGRDASVLVLCPRAGDGHHPCQRYCGHRAAVSDVSWSAGGARIASAGSDATVQVWSPAP